MSSWEGNNSLHLRGVEDKVAFSMNELPPIHFWPIFFSTFLLRASCVVDMTISPPTPPYACEVQWKMWSFSSSSTPMIKLKCESRPWTQRTRRFYDYLRRKKTNFLTQIRRFESIEFLPHKHTTLHFRLSIHTWMEISLEFICMCVEQHSSEIRIVIECGYLFSSW